eukprot:GSA25T00016252001.1
MVNQLCPVSRDSDGEGTERRRLEAFWSEMKASRMDGVSEPEDFSPTS